MSEREKCREMVEDKEFDDLITKWIKDGEFDDDVIERAIVLLERR